MNYRTIRYETADQVATITLNRPESRNAISPLMINEIIHALECARADDEVRVIVITGAGKGFSAGGDLGMMGGGGNDGDGETVEIKHGFPALNLAFARNSKPTIAKVNGHAMAGGLGLMVACDFAIASDKAEFATPEINVGLFPMMIMANIFRNVPRKRGLELVLLGERIDAREAERIGLITRAVPAAELDTAVDALAAKLKAKSPAILRLGLEAFYAQQDMALEEALPYLEQMLGRCFETEDFREGVAAFLEKRPPRWKGK
ncbi:MAG: enoyl-CoA hydratase-related protein [bacterium]